MYVNNAEREILPPGFYMTRINSLEPERNYVIQVESIVTVGADVQSTSEKAMIKVRTRPPGPPEPPQSPILEDDPMNSKQVLIRWLPGIELYRNHRQMPLRNLFLYDVS